MMDALHITPRLVIPASDFRASTSRSGGAGGQHVNTTDTRVRVWFELSSCAVLRPEVKQRIRDAHPGKLTDSGQLVLTCGSFRSQHRNLEEVRTRLTELIRAALVRPKVRRATKPSRASQRRRVDAKKRRSQIKSGRGKVRYD